MFREFDYSIVDEIKNEEKVSYPLSFCVKKAEGAYLIEENGRKYLDFTSNLDNQPLGYSYFQAKETNNIIFSGLFNSSIAKKLEKELFTLTGLKKSVFASSKDQMYKLLNSLLKSNLSENGKDKVIFIGKEEYKSIFSNINADFAPINNESVIKSIFTKNVMAVVVEIIRVDGDIAFADIEYLKLLRKLCDKNGAILVFDVSSISPLRAGKTFFNYDNSVKPDVIAVSKGLSHEILFGALILSEKINFSNQSSFSLLAVEQTLDFIEKSKNPDLKKIISSNTDYLEKRLKNLLKQSISVVDVESYGMLFKIVINKSAFEFAKRCFKRGLIIEPLNSNTIKLTPPYIITKGEVDKLMSIMNSVLGELTNEVLQVGLK